MPDRATLIVADAHLGYSWAQRRRGELGPIVDERTAKKLSALISELQPARIVFLGDLVHAPRPCEPERAWIESVLTEAGQRSELIAVRGNHDRAFAREFPHLKIASVEQWVEEGITAVHGDKLPAQAEGTLVVGHFHPAIPVRDAAGAGQKLPVFLAGSKCVLLPAFSPFAGGYDLVSGLPGELVSLFPDDPQAFAASGTRVVALGPLSRAIRRIFTADAGAAERFRWRA